MTDKEASIKMAEMCGYEIIQSQFSSALIINNSLDEWNPRENIAQAMWVLSNICDGDYTCDDSLEEAIFNAVKQFMEGEG